jgi:hypothetical protein
MTAVVLAVAAGVLVGASHHRSATFTTARSGEEDLPRSDAWCAGRAADGGHETRPVNRTANRSLPGGAVSWSTAPENVRWTTWVKKRSLVTGRFEGTTDQIFRWAACKWGLDEDLLRAVAAQESGWDQRKVGDRGESFGIMQIKDHYGDGSPAWGGFPDTLRATALNVDFYAAYLRSCYDGDFYDGGRWLYGGQSIGQVLEAHGAGYALWGCVGSWFSGRWYDSKARAYVAQVRHRLATRDWPISSSD